MNANSTNHKYGEKKLMIELKESWQNPQIAEGKRMPGAMFVLLQIKMMNSKFSVKAYRTPRQCTAFYSLQHIGGRSDITYLRCIWLSVQPCAWVQHKIVWVNLQCWISSFKRFSNCIKRNEPRKINKNFFSITQ